MNTNFFLALGSVDWNTLLAAIKFSIYCPNTWFSDFSFKFSSFTESTLDDKSAVKQQVIFFFFFILMKRNYLPCQQWIRNMRPISICLFFQTERVEVQQHRDIKQNLKQLKIYVD